jgi:membrane protease YdiL (CAAX protease family)
VFLLGVFAPAIVALGLTFRQGGRAAVELLVARIGRWQVNTWFYAFAIGYMAAVRLGAAVVHRLAVGEWPRFGDTPWLLMLAAILVSTWVQAGEEIGWRGYALPRLARGLGLGAASVVLGAIWALWHLPQFVMGGGPDSGQSFPVYLLIVTALSVAMAWVYWRTSGSLLLVMLLHASVNNTAGIVPAAVPGAANPFTMSGSIVAWTTAGLLWCVAAPLLVSMRRAQLEADGTGASGVGVGGERAV